MKKRRSILVLILIAMALMACDEENEKPQNICNRDVIISATEYKSAPNDPLTISKLEMDGDSLRISFRSSGCSGNTWELKLIDAGIIMESYPPQRNLRLSLKNEEVCDAVISKEVAYNICELQVEGELVLLNIINSGEQIQYQYKANR